MNVAFALFRYFAFGGMQRDMLTTAKLCRARGHSITIYCHTWDGDRPDDLQVVVLPARGIANHQRARHFAASLQRQLATSPPDVVIGFDKLPGLDLYFAADPCFVTRTEHRPWLYRLTARYRTFRRLEQAVFDRSGATRILLLDERERSNYQATWQTSDDRFIPLPPGIARDRCRGPDSAAQRRLGRKQFGIADDQHLLLLLAANFELKGLDRAMRAIAALPNAQRQRTHLLAVGQTPPAALQQLARQLGMHDHITMLPGREDVPLLLQAADLLLHPARRDTTGTVLLEALVAGLPVLCTDACGYAAHIRAANCGHVLTQPFQQESLDGLLADLLSRDLQTERDAAIAYAGQHDLHGMQDAIVRAIES